MQPPLAVPEIKGGEFSAACSPEPAAAAAARSWVSVQGAGKRRVLGGGGVLASVVRAAGKASVSLVPPVAASGLRGPGNKGSWGLDRSLAFPQLVKGARERR